MAESARNKDPVYDDESKKPSTPPGRDDGVPRDDLRNAEEGFYNPTGDAEKAEDKSSSPDELNEAESTQSSDSDGGFKFNPNDSGQRGRIGNVLKAAGGNKRYLALAVGGGAGIIGTFVVVFLMLIPLKIEHIVSNLDKRFFATSENALERETNNALSRYVKKHVLPALKECSGSTIDKNCNPHFGNSNNPVDALYKGWSDNRLENKLASKYGIEFRYNKLTNKYYMKAPGIRNPNGDDITKFVGDDGNLFQEVSRGQVRQSVSDAMQKETRWKKMMYRFKVGRLLEEKFGIKRCNLFCGKRDAANDLKDRKINKAQLLIAQRVVTPVTENMGILLQCLLDSTCDPTSTSEQAPIDGESSELNGAPESQVETESRQRFVELAASYDLTDRAALEKLIGDYKNISEKGFQKYFVAKAMEKIGLSAISDQVANATPVVGWITKAADIITRLRNIGPTSKKLAYLAGSAGAVSTYSLLRTQADEIHTGGVDATQVGYISNALSPGNHGAASDPIVGGTAGAENTPLYSSIMGGDLPSSSTALFDGLLPGKASAATLASANYKCGNGKPVPSGKLVCSEEEFGLGNATANNISDFMNQGFVGTLSTGASFINSIAGKAASLLGNFLGAIINHIPGVGSVENLVSNAISPFFTDLVTKVLPNPFGTNMSGGRIFDMAAGGADVAGNLFAHNGLGGKLLSSAQVASIRDEQNQQSLTAFKHESLISRTFATDSEYSLVSRVALATPFSNQTSLQSSFASIISNPFGWFSHSFGSIFSSSRATAAPTSSDDPFGVTQYGYESSDIPSDPEAYWDQHCSDNAAQAYQNDAEYAANSYNKYASAHPNDSNGMPQNDSVNPCLLIKAMVGSAGGVYNTDLLTPDEQQVLNQGSSTTGRTGSESNAAGLPSGSSQELAKQLLPFIADGKIRCASAAGGSGPADCQDIQNTAKGVPIGGSCAVDKLSPHLLGLILALVRDDNWTLGISSICSNHHPEGDGPYGGHSHGSTADFSIENGASGSASASNEKFVNDVASLLSSTGGSFGQVGNCHPIYPSQKSSKFTTFTDSCTHQHVRAAP